MTLIKDNSVYEKTSFLSKTNSTFIETMYIKYISEDPSLPNGWKEFFDGLGDDEKYILNEIQGPSWTPNKIDIKKIVKHKKVSKDNLSNGDISLREKNKKRLKEYKKELKKKSKQTFP